jgi:hypothetical protein
MDCPAASAGVIAERLIPEPRVEFTNGDQSGDLLAIHDMPVLQDGPKGRWAVKCAVARLDHLQEPFRLIGAEHLRAKFKSIIVASESFCYKRAEVEYGGVPSTGLKINQGKPKGVPGGYQ